MSTQSLTTNEPTFYGAIRNRDVEDPHHLEAAMANKGAWMKCIGGIVLGIIVVAVICIAILFPSNPLQAEIFSKPSIFGGVYSIASNTDYNVVNHYTNDLSCPDGHTSYIVGHFNACFECGDTTLYLCLRDDFEKDPRGFFGGMFNVNDCGGEQFANPLTNTFGCNGKEGYHPYLAIASQTDNYCDTNIFVCLKGHIDYHNLGGFYTEFTNPNGCMTCTEGNVFNGLIDSLECPQKYNRHLIAFAYSKGGINGCPGCNGRAYICEMAAQQIEIKHL